MRSIAIINQKGGVGKTTTAVNLSAALADQGLRIGLIDLDPQAHASLHLGTGMQQDQPTVYELLTSDVSLADIWQPVGENLSVASSHIDLAAAEVELAGVVGRELILRDKLALVEDQFDFVLIDCPPSLGILTINALSAVDDVFSAFAAALFGPARVEQAAADNRPSLKTPERPPKIGRRGDVSLRVGHTSGGRGEC